MPSNGAKPFFLDSALLEQYGYGMKMRKEPMNERIKADTDLQTMENCSMTRNSVPSPAAMPQSAMGVHLRHAQQLVDNNGPSNNTFQGFQFQLPWAPHLSGINIGIPEVSSTSGSSRVRSLPFDYDVRSGGRSQGSPVSQSSEKKLQCLSLNSRCYNVIKPQRRQQESSRTMLNIKHFKSLSNPARKRTHDDMLRSVEESGSQQCSADSQNMKRQRFHRTAEALKKSGLLNVTMKSATLIQQNRKLQQEIEQLRQETMQFMRSVLNNPENEHLVPVSIST